MQLPASALGVYIDDRDFESADLDGLPAGAVVHIRIRDFGWRTGTPIGVPPHLIRALNAAALAKAKIVVGYAFLDPDLGLAKISDEDLGRIVERFRSLIPIVAANASGVRWIVGNEPRWTWAGTDEAYVEIEAVLAALPAAFGAPVVMGGDQSVEDFLRFLPLRLARWGLRPQAWAIHGYGVSGFVPDHLDIARERAVAIEADFLRAKSPTLREPLFQDAELLVLEWAFDFFGKGNAKTKPWVHGPEGIAYARNFAAGIVERKNVSGAFFTTRNLRDPALRSALVAGATNPDLTGPWVGMNVSAIRKKTVGILSAPAAFNLSLSNVLRALSIAGKYST